MSRLVLALRTSICSPRAAAPVCTSLVTNSLLRLAGLTSTAKCDAAGKSSCTSPTFFAASSASVTRDVTTRPVEIGDKTRLDRVAADTEDDRDGRGRGFGRQSRRCACWRGDNGDLAAGQVGRHRRQTIVSTFRPAVCDSDVLALDITGLAQPLKERTHIARESVR